MASSAMPAYYELSWAILSTIGLTNVLVAIMVMGIAGFSMVSFVPLVVSIATAVANGMCYYAFYSNYPMVNTAVASAFADVSWLIQEAGLSFYSYVILFRVLVNRERTIFLILFWTLMGVICALRLTILICRIGFIMGGSSDSVRQKLVDNLHVGYFTSIALVECLSAVFLLKTFTAARRTSMNVAIRGGGLFSYLMRSTEIRLALLAVVGVTRAVTYSFQDTAQSAEGISGQVDRFAYTLECLFPIVMFIDILASRLVFATNGRSHETSSHSRSRQANVRRNTHHEMEPGAVKMYPVVSQTGRRGELKSVHHSSDATSSQEHIIESNGTTTTDVEAGVAITTDQRRDADGNGISKTVEFNVSHSERWAGR